MGCGNLDSDVGFQSSRSAGPPRRYRYEAWDGGSGLSMRYLVAMLPVMVAAVKTANPKGHLFKLAVAYSLFWGCLGGLSPALVYERSPWGVFQHVLSKTNVVP